MSNFLSAHKMPYQLNPCSQPFRLIRLFLRNIYQTLKAYSLCKRIFILMFSGMDRESSYKSQTPNLSLLKFNIKRIRRSYPLLGMIIDL